MMTEDYEVVDRNEDEVDNARLYVGNLVEDVTKENIVHIFKRVGYVKDIFISRTVKFGRTFAFVTMESVGQAMNAVRILDGLYGPDGGELQVRPAGPRRALQ